MLSLRAKQLKRYRDILRLLVKHGRSDWVQQAGLEDVIKGPEETVGPAERAKAEELAEDLEQLGPTFIKLGQLLSTRPDILPPPYLKALTRLQDAIEPFPMEQVEQIITRELGMSLSRMFEHFDPVPIASASLAQVHRATLHNGRQVAVKVQRPGIPEQMVDDLKALDDLAGLLDRYTETGRHYEFRRLVETLRKTLLRELDFRNEAANLKTLRENLKPFGCLLVPQPLEDYTTARVLTMDYMSGTKITEADLESVPTAEREGLAEELFSAYLHQVLVDGFFHADPHPGNLYLTATRRIAVLDLGMVARVPPRIQELLVKLLLDIAEGRGEEAAIVASKIGMPTKFFDKQRFYERITHLVKESQDVSLERLKLGHVVLEIQAAAAENGTRLPEEITMLSKTLLNLEKSLGTLAPQYDLNAAIRRHASEILEKRTRKQLSLENLYHAWLEVNELVVMLPERVNRIMDLLAENELKVRVDAIDELQLIQGFQKIANRITMGIILAAIIVGASVMMHVETALTVFGYPAIAMFFFLAAGTGGLLLILQILLKDRRRR